jgi:hypothetical protein
VFVSVYEHYIICEVILKCKGGAGLAGHVSAVYCVMKPDSYVIFEAFIVSKCNELFSGNFLCQDGTGFCSGHCHFLHHQELMWWRINPWWWSNWLSAQDDFIAYAHIISTLHTILFSEASEVYCSTSAFSSCLSVYEGEWVKSISIDGKRIRIILLLKTDYMFNFPLMHTKLHSSAQHNNSATVSPL